MSTDRVVLDGGVASDVAIVHEPDGREVVVKRALPKLKVEADWRSDPSRSNQEVEALRAAQTLLGEGVVPRVFWVDSDNHRFAMERIDPRLANWQVLLSSGSVSLPTATRVGELLGLLQSRSALAPQLAETFGNRQFFEQLRIEPFFDRSAQRNPLARGAIDAVIEWLRAPGQVLVHGDYSPKNMLVRDERVVLLDWEVAHWGEPRFDIAFCVSHLLLSGWRFGKLTRPFREACDAFCTAYSRHGLVSASDRATTAMIACLVLARLDGDSPVNYLHELDVGGIRATALRLLLEPAPPWSELSSELMS